jgi:hypothetical protein
VAGCETRCPANRKERGEEGQQGEENKQIVSLKVNVVREKADRNANNNDTECIFYARLRNSIFIHFIVSHFILQVGSFYVPWVLYSAILVFYSPLFISSEAQRLKEFQARC